MNVYWYITEHQDSSLFLQMYNITTKEKQDYGPALPNDCAKIRSLGIQGINGAIQPYIFCRGSSTYSIHYLSSAAGVWQKELMENIDGVQKVSPWGSAFHSGWYWTVLTDTGLYVSLQSSTGETIRVCESTRTSRFSRSSWSQRGTLLVLLNDGEETVSMCDLRSGQWSQHTLQETVTGQSSHLELLSQNETFDWMIIMRRNEKKNYIDVYAIGKSFAILLSKKLV